MVYSLFFPVMKKERKKKATAITQYGLVTLMFAGYACLRIAASTSFSFSRFSFRNFQFLY